jgi:CMP-N-acetylneuraminic acid synthetase
MKKRLLVIPARSGSKRIKNKNFKNFKGKPIIEYSIQTAIKSKIFNTIHISSDDIKIIKLVKKYKLKNQFLRPKNISGGNDTIEDVLRFVVKKYKEENIFFDEIWSLSPCSPLIKVKDLVNSSKILNKYNNRIILPISEFPCPIEWAFAKKKNNFLQPVSKKSYLKKSQLFKKKFYDVGNFVGIPINFFDKRKIKFDENYIGYVIPKHRSVDIDEIDDWKLAEKLYGK